MEKEQIIKALECFHQRILNTNLAEKITETEMMAIIDSLALIKELAEANATQIVTAIELDKQVERLTEENETLKDSNEHLAVFLTEAKADTVREMQERLKAEAYVPKPYGMSKVVDVGTIDRIAKEILNKTEDEKK